MYNNVKFVLKNKSHSEHWYLTAIQEIQFHVNKLAGRKIIIC